MRKSLIVSTLLLMLGCVSVQVTPIGKIVKCTSNFSTYVVEKLENLVVGPARSHTYTY